MSKHQYTVAVEDYLKSYEELKVLYKQSYEHLVERRREDGIIYPEYNPWLKAYKEYYDSGALVLYVVREFGEAIGYCMMYLTQSMQNQELIACEDSVYLAEGHRNGLGKVLGNMVIQDMCSRGVKRLMVSARDRRIANMLKTMKAKEVAIIMELALWEAPKHQRPLIRS